MVLLRIQHPVGDFERWKAAFDSDPLDRRGSAVRGYAVHRDADDPAVVVIDLEFDEVDAARAMLARLESMWSSRPAGIAAEPRTAVLETVERVALQ
ncbi:hypothetical protein ACFC1W_13095 [Microbacterium sp. NPDC056003]|uniref:hypothetical protein n=1 Tax=Microbacterium sp. NPDC056003 TaxID=3345676 RepID=UPI0035DD78D6